MALLPAAAHAAPPPSTADYTAADVSATNHQWYVTGTTTTATTIATGGTVTFNYPTGNSRHNVNFTSAAKPASCQRAGAAPAAPPVPATATAPPWSAACTFTQPGTYTFNCQLHPTMIGTINVVGTPQSEGGTVPATLSLTIGTSASFGTFLLGVAQDYAAQVQANVTETAADARLSVADPSATAPGHLVNGTFAMAKALQIRATDAANPNTVFADVPGAANPLTLLTWGGPVSNDAITVSLKQTVGASDPLRTGAYSKSLTFTLSTTNP